MQQLDALAGAFGDLGGVHGVVVKGGEDRWEMDDLSGGDLDDAFLERYSNTDDSDDDEIDVLSEYETPVDVLAGPQLTLRDADLGMAQVDRDVLWQAAVTAAIGLTIAGVMASERRSSSMGSYVPDVPPGFEGDALEPTQVASGDEDDQPDEPATDMAQADTEPPALGDSGLLPIRPLRPIRRRASRLAPGTLVVQPPRDGGQIPKLIYIGTDSKPRDSRGMFTRIA